MTHLIIFEAQNQFVEAWISVSDKAIGKANYCSSPIEKMKFIGFDLSYMEIFKGRTKQIF